ncbi:MAG: hypothetical protein ACR2NY_00475 [Alphaproteobacteria bacterium]
MIFVRLMTHHSLPLHFRKAVKPPHILFVKQSLKNAPFHVKWAIVILTLCYLPFLFLKLDKILRKHIHFFQLLIRVYRSLTFLVLFEGDKK